MALLSRSKIIISIIFLYSVFVNVNIFPFDYAAYKESSCDTINEILQTEIKELNDGARGPGVTIFVEKTKLTITWGTGYPVEISKDSSSSLSYFAKATTFYQEYGDAFINVFSYELPYSCNNQDYIFLFQNNLMKYLPGEVQEGDTIELYCIFGSYNDFSKKILILVNEFHVLK